MTSGRILNYPCVRSIDNVHVEVFDAGYVTVHTHTHAHTRTHAHFVLSLPSGWMPTMHLYSRTRYNHPRRHCNIVLTANRRVVRSITRRDFLVDRWSMDGSIDHRRRRTWTEEKKDIIDTFQLFCHWLFLRSSSSLFSLQYSKMFHPRYFKWTLPD